MSKDATKLKVALFNRDDSLWSTNVQRQVEEPCASQSQHPQPMYFINSNAHVSSRQRNLLPHSKRCPSPEERQCFGQAAISDDPQLNSSISGMQQSSSLQENSIKRMARRKSSECGGVFGVMTQKVQQRGKMFPLTLICMHVKRVLVEAARKRRDKEKVVFKSYGRKILSNGSKEFTANKSFKNTVKSHFNAIISSPIAAAAAASASPPIQSLSTFTSAIQQVQHASIQTKDVVETQKSHAIEPTATQRPINSNIIQSSEATNGVASQINDPTIKEAGKMDYSPLLISLQQPELSQQLFIPFASLDDINQGSPESSSSLSCSPTSRASPNRGKLFSDQRSSQFSASRLHGRSNNNNDGQTTPLSARSMKESQFSPDEPLLRYNVINVAQLPPYTHSGNSPRSNRRGDDGSGNDSPSAKKSMFKLSKNSQIQEVVQEYFEPGSTQNSAFSPENPGQRHRAMRKVFVTATNMITLQNKVKANNAFFKSYYSLVGRIGLDGDASLMCLAQIADEVLSAPMTGTKHSEKPIAAPIKRKVFIHIGEEDKVKLITQPKTLKLNKSVQNYVQKNHQYHSHHHSLHDSHSQLKQQRPHEKNEFRVDSIITHTPSSQLSQTERHLQSILRSNEQRPARKATNSLFVSNRLNEEQQQSCTMFRKYSAGKNISRSNNLNPFAYARVCKQGLGPYSSPQMRSSNSCNKINSGGLLHLPLISLDTKNTHYNNRSLVKDEVFPTRMHQYS